jgi:hypothetical protein
LTHTGHHGVQELDPESTIREFRIVATDGKNRQIKHYNLDAIINVGYRVHSPVGIRVSEVGNSGIERDAGVFQERRGSLSREMRESFERDAVIRQDSAIKQKLKKTKKLKK